ncbi:MAG: hypothetical protein PHQ58_00110 [Rhodoferax sp.]|uniref:O-methyltransferase n=1 Tax=Rhodoferax sp. TaxID=50421 RepID=UPI002629F344|nr:O-methyltransferase [Rhodoferax sp.]MDD2878814.1 hypothetical protein [Rhodoferax sp.]
MGFEESEGNMSGGAIAYHLRENKAIERNLFIELLVRVGRVENISDYTYIGFGGPFLEDFKALHAALRISKMISIEMDENVCKRQAFNSPADFIEIRKCKSGEFLISHDFDKHNIVWLDYTTPRGLYGQLAEFRLLVSKLGKFDIAKITLNANPETLGGNATIEEKLEKLKRCLGDLCKFNLDEDDILPKKYPATLLKAIHSALGGLSARVSGDYFQPLSAFVYQDGGHPMLTVTGVILDAKNDLDKSLFLEKSRIAHWAFKNLDWSPPLVISVPALSTKERLTLDTALPIGRTENAGELLVEKLGYCPSESGGEYAAKLLLANYSQFYRAYPLFSRVVL